jgi:hypothetical protein
MYYVLYIKYIIKGGTERGGACTYIAMKVTRFSLFLSEASP